MNDWNRKNKDEKGISNGRDERRRRREQRQRDRRDDYKVFTSVDNSNRGPEIIHHHIHDKRSTHNPIILILCFFLIISVYMTWLR